MTNEADDPNVDFHNEIIIDFMLQAGATLQEAFDTIDELYWYGALYSPDESEIIEDAFEDLFSEMSNDGSTID